MKMKINPKLNSKPINKTMVEKLAKHERLALYNLTEREIDQLEEELVKQFPKNNLQRHTSRCGKFIEIQRLYKYTI